MVQCAIEARWDEFVSLLQFALNSALVARHHDGMSLLFFVFGRQAGWPAAVELPATSLDPLSPWSLWPLYKRACRKRWMCGG